MAKLKVWSGSAWVEKPANLWGVGAWLLKPWKMWDGSLWGVIANGGTPAISGMSKSVDRVGTACAAGSYQRYWHTWSCNADVSDSLHDLLIVWTTNGNTLTTRITNPTSGSAYAENCGWGTGSAYATSYTWALVLKGTSTVVNGQTGGSTGTKCANFCA